jgi:hypothetical protein
MLMRGCGAWAVGLCESIRLGEGRSRPGLRVLRETAFNKVKLSHPMLHGQVHQLNGTRRSGGYGRRLNVANGGMGDGKTADTVAAVA